ncbi:hypothetical protein O1L55_34890 [Streptomyces albulus]|nr:hypothetical protein [Streptomyces noursei]
MVSQSRLVVGLTYNLRGESVEHFGAGPPREGYDAEFDEWETVQTVAGVLEGLGYRCVLIGALPALMERLLRGERWDVVFNLAEGHHGYGREAQVPALLEEWRIPFTFSDSLCLSLCLHKPTTQLLLRQAGVTTAPFAVVREPHDIDGIDLPYPLFAKPVAEGTSKGIGADSRVDDARELRSTCTRLLQRHGQPVMVEPYLPGPEYTVGILGAGADARAIGVSQTLHDRRTTPFLTDLRKRDASGQPVPCGPSRTPAPRSASPASPSGPGARSVAGTPAGSTCGATQPVSPTSWTSTRCPASAPPTPRCPSSGPAPAGRTASSSRAS